MEKADHLPSFEKTRQLVRVALSEGAHLKPPRFVSRPKWQREIEMLLTYMPIEDDQPPLSQPQVGRIFGVTRQWVSLSNMKVIRRFWENCSPETQQLFPSQELVLRRPILKENKPLPFNEKSTQRNFLKEALQLANQIRGAQTDQEIQSSLSEVNNQTVYQYLRSEENPAIIPISQIAREAGFHYHPRAAPHFLQSAQKANIPLGEVEISPKSGPRKGLIARYCFAAFSCQKRLGQTFLGDDSLGKFLTNPVQQLCGPAVDQIPNTGELRSSGKFSRPRHLFVKLGVSFVGGSRFNSTQFWTAECPVPIFQHRSYSYPVEQEQVLWQYLQTKYAKLRGDIIGPNETPGHF